MLHSFVTLSGRVASWANEWLYTVVDLWRPKQMGMSLQVKRSEGLEGEKEKERD